MLKANVIRTARYGLTLIELLTVLVVVSVLLTLTVPAVLRAREDARKATCKGKLAQLGLALHNYHALYQCFPAGWIGADSGQPQLLGPNGVGWGSPILPQFGEDVLYNQMNFARHVTDPANDSFRHAVASWKTEWLHCPNDERTATWAHTMLGRRLVLPSTSYVAVFGTTSPTRCFNTPNKPCKGDGLFYQNSFRALRDIRDGSANTVVLAERRPPASTEPWHSTWIGIIPTDKDTLSRLVGSGEVAPGEPGGSVADYRGFHADRMTVLLGDGSVRLINENINPNVFRAVLTISSAESNCDIP